MNAGYYASPWPAEDAGPARLQACTTARGFAVQDGRRLHSTSRNTTLSTMTVLGDPGEVYLLTHSALRSNFGLPTTSCVERIDPITLATLESSGRLPGGPMWPGGLAVHRNGDLYVVYGRYAHRLNRHCVLKQSRMLPVNQPYNSFVVLDNGLIVTKNLSDKQPAQLTVLDPEGLQPVCADVLCPEPSIARLSAVGNTVYVVGVRSIFRLQWDAPTQTLQRDPHWCWDYIGTSAQSYGWDVVIDGQSAWFMDNGHHRYRIRMQGAGVSRTANRLLRVSLSDSDDYASLAISGLPGGSITNPPLVDVHRRMCWAMTLPIAFCVRGDLAMTCMTCNPFGTKQTLAWLATWFYFQSARKWFSTTIGAGVRKWWCWTSIRASNRAGCVWVVSRRA